MPARETHVAGVNADARKIQREVGLVKEHEKYARQDLNLQPLAPEASALSN